MPALPTLTNGQTPIGKTGFDAVAAYPANDIAVKWTAGAGTLRADHDMNEGSVNPTGTTQGAAATLDVDTYSAFQIQGTVGDTAVKFSFTTKRLEGVIWNTHASLAALLFPHSGGSINALAADASISVPANTVMRFFSYSNSVWVVETTTKAT